MNCVWFGGDNTAPDTAAARYHHLTPSFTDSFSATENQRQNVISEDITITQFRVFMGTAPGAGKSYTWTIRKNGSSVGMPTVTISDTNTEAIWNGSVSFSEGDLLTIEVVPTGTPSSSTNNDWHIYYSTTGQKFLLLGAMSSTLPTGATNYGVPSGASGSGWNTDPLVFETVCPTDLTLTKLRVATADGSPGSGKSYAISVRRNNASDDLTATIADADTQAVATGSVAWAPGDTYVIKEVPSGTPTARRPSWCMTLTPATNGEMIYGFGGNQALSVSTGANQYEQIYSNGNNGWNSSENVRYTRPPNVIFKKLYVKLSAAPGAGSSRTFTLRDNGGDTALTTTISNTDTTGNDTSNTPTMSGGGNTSTMKMTTHASVAPAAANAHYGYVMYIAQATSQIKKLSSIAQANLKKVSSVAIASVSKISSVQN